MPYQAIFQNEPACGTPDAPTPLGFLRLAQPGRNTWNAWRAAHGGAVRWRMDNVPPVELQDHPQLDFADFNFGAATQFITQTFLQHPANFANATFGDDSVFEGIRFDTGVRFTGARFGNNCRLRGINVRADGQQQLPANPNGWVSFENVIFGDNAEITELRVDWNRASVWDEISFKDSSFGRGSRVLVRYLRNSLAYGNVMASMGDAV